MGDKLLIRAYDVEVGDCFYIRIPDDGDGFHMLVDCGSKSKDTLLGKAIADLRKDLPVIAGTNKKRIDLVVVTHAHADHISGFRTEYFEGIRIENLWMSAAMDPNNTKAKDTHSLHSLAETQVMKLVDSGVPLSPALEDMFGAFGVNNKNALKALEEDLDLDNRHYVHAGMDSGTLGVSPKDTKIHVIGPDKDIDRYYLGKDTGRRLMGIGNSVAGTASTAPAAKANPTNISPADFRQLRSRLLSNALALASMSNKVKNNASVILIIEWRGRRLLFVGDAEWLNTFRDGKKNGGWNVLWHRQQAMINQPVDFLKIGHHGSENSTPWKQTDKAVEPEAMLNAILPPDTRSADGPVAVVSTMRNKYPSIPRSELLAEIGSRVSNTRRYQRALKAKGIDHTKLLHYQEREKKWLDKPQPYRTDLETMLNGKDYVEIELSPKSR
ncbi:MAG: MBL fold metallo-hydrolase [Hyphomicrobiales bacterium]|nr:MBL fold metallo-hydrolase [Hyphomicrobiales bacterium]